MNLKKVARFALLFLMLSIFLVAVQADLPRCHEDDDLVTFGEVDSADFTADWHFYNSSEWPLSLLFVGDAYHNLVFYSRNGVVYQQLCQTGSGPDDIVTLTATVIHTFNPSTGKRSTISVAFLPHEQGAPLFIGETATVDGDTYYQVPPPASVQLIPLPNEEIPVGIYKFADGDEFFVLSYDRYHYTSESAQLTLLTPDGNYEFEVTEVERLAGTLTVVTSEGTLTLPSQSSGQPPTWGDLPLRSLDVDTCFIAYSLGRVTCK